jgi:hypothetical protein
MSFVGKILAFASVTTLAITSYLGYQYLLLKKNVELAFTRKPRFVVTQISFKRINLKLIYQIINPGVLSAKLTGYDMDILLNGDKVGHISGSDVIAINSKKVNGGVSELPLLVNFVPNDILDKGLKNIGLLIDKSQWSQVVIRIIGTFNFSSPPLTGKIPLDISFSLSDVIN